MTDGALSTEFKSQIQLRLRESRTRIIACLDELDEADLWKRPNASSNSVGNLLLHLKGNLTQWALSGLDGAPDDRVRDAEFAAREGAAKAVLGGSLIGAIDAVIEAIGRADEAALLRVRPVQGHTVSGLAILIHVTEHLSYHTGQIAFWTKLLKEKDLGFYKGVDLNRKNG